MPKVAVSEYRYTFAGSQSYLSQQIDFIIDKMLTLKPKLTSILKFMKAVDGDDLTFERIKSVGQFNRK